MDQNEIGLYKSHQVYAKSLKSAIFIHQNYKFDLLCNVKSTYSRDFLYIMIHIYQLSKFN